jgi:hypothetical protein
MRVWFRSRATRDALVNEAPAQAARSTVRPAPPASMTVSAARVTGLRFSTEIGRDGLAAEALNRAVVTGGLPPALLGPALGLATSALLLASGTLPTADALVEGLLKPAGKRKGMPGVVTPYHLLTAARCAGVARALGPGTRSRLEAALTVPSELTAEALVALGDEEALLAVLRRRPATRFVSGERARRAAWWPVGLSATIGRVGRPGPRVVAAIAELFLDPPEAAARPHLARALAQIGSATPQVIDALLLQLLDTKSQREADEAAAAALARLLPRNPAHATQRAAVWCDAILACLPAYDRHADGDWTRWLHQAVATFPSARERLLERLRLLAWDDRSWESDIAIAQAAGGPANNDPALAAVLLDHCRGIYSIGGVRADAARAWLETAAPELLATVDACNPRVEDESGGVGLDGAAQDPDLDGMPPVLQALGISVLHDLHASPGLPEALRREARMAAARLTLQDLDRDPIAAALSEIDGSTGIRAVLARIASDKKSKPASPWELLDRLERMGYDRMTAAQALDELEEGLRALVAVLIASWVTRKTGRTGPVSVTLPPLHLTAAETLAELDRKEFPTLSRLIAETGDLEALRARWALAPRLDVSDRPADAQSRRLDRAARPRMHVPDVVRADARLALHRPDLRSSSFAPVLEALVGGDSMALQALRLAPEGLAWQRTDSFHPALFSLQRLSAPTSDVFALIVNLLEEPGFGQLEQRALARVLRAVNPTEAPHTIPVLVRLAGSFRSQEDARGALSRITEATPLIVEALGTVVEGVLASALADPQNRARDASQTTTGAGDLELAVVFEVLWRLRTDAEVQEIIRGALTLRDVAVRALVVQSIPALRWIDEELLRSLLRVVGAYDPLTPLDARRSMREAVSDLLDVELPDLPEGMRAAIVDVLALLAVGREDLYLLLLEYLHHDPAPWVGPALRPAMRMIGCEVDEPGMPAEVPGSVGAGSQLSVALAALAREQTGDMSKDLGVSSGLDMVRKRLAEVPDEAVIAALRAFLPVAEDELHWEAPYAAARLLGKLGGGHPEVIETLHACLTHVSSLDARSEVAEAAVRALRDLGDTSERTLQLITGIALFAGTATVQAIQAWLRELGPDFPGLIELIVKQLDTALYDELDPERSYLGLAALYLLDVLQEFAVPHPALAELLLEWLPRGANLRTTAPRRVAETLGVLAYVRPDDPPERRRAREPIRRALQRQLAVADVRLAGWYHEALRVADAGTPEE